MFVDNVEVRPIDDSPDYGVSCSGRVCRITPRPPATAYLGPWIRPATNRKNGYKYVSLAARSYSVHRLVFRAWVGEIPDGFDVSHLDGCKTNNRVNNLVAESRLDNIRRKVDHGTQVRGSQQNGAKLTEEQVREIRSKYQQRVYSYGRLAKEYGVHVQCIAGIITRRNWDWLK